MTGMIRKATLLVVLGLVVSSAAMAGIPSAANCLIPTFVDLVACDGTGALPPAARYIATITVRDIANVGCPNLVISLSFCTDVGIYSVIPGGTVVGPVFTKTAVTDALGQATVEISGAGWNASGATVGTNGANCVTWFASGYELGKSNVATYDEDGKTLLTKQGVAGTDLVAFLSDFFDIATPYKPRSDFDHSTLLGGGDLSFWLTYFLSIPAYNASCGTLN